MRARMAWGGGRRHGRWRETNGDASRGHMGMGIGIEEEEHGARNSSAGAVDGCAGGGGARRRGVMLRRRGGRDWRGVKMTLENFTLRLVFIPMAHHCRLQGLNRQ